MQDLTPLQFPYCPKTDPRTDSTFIMTIRTYVDSDCAAGLGIFDSNVPEYFASAERAEFARFLQAPDADFFVVERDGSVVGCGGCYVRDSIGRLC